MDLEKEKEAQIPKLDRLKYSKETCKPGEQYEQSCLLK
jgi:hypothetical protein